MAGNEVRLEPLDGEHPAGVVTIGFGQLAGLPMGGSLDDSVIEGQQIVDQVRGESYAVTERIVDVQMVSLRKKLGALGDWIETVRGVGYRFKEV